MIEVTKYLEDDFSDLINDETTLKDLIYHFVTKYPSYDQSYKKKFAENIIANKFINKKLPMRKIIEFVDFEISHFDKSKIKFPEKTSDNIIPKKSKRGVSIYDIDAMNPFEFESFAAKLLEYDGYVTEVTKKTGDQGADIVAQKNGEKWAIQTKRYELGSKVSNNAIQEAFTGKEYYKCPRAAVLTNQFFTKSAIEIATTTKVELWDRRFLINLLKKYNEIS